MIDTLRPSELIGADLTANETLLLVRDELRGWARHHAAIKAGMGQVDDVDAFADWLVSAFTEPHIDPRTIPVIDE